MVAEEWIYAVDKESPKHQKGDAEPYRQQNQLQKAEFVLFENMEDEKSG